MILKYECCDPKVKNQILLLKNNMNPVVYKHIQDLYELIDYQVSMIHEQRREIISMKHNDAWKHYDKDNQS